MGRPVVGSKTSAIVQKNRAVKTWKLVKLRLRAKILNDKKMVREGPEDEAAEEEDTDADKDFLILIIMREPLNEQMLLKENADNSPATSN